MSQVTFGDLSTPFLNQAHNVRLKMMMNDLGRELASGQTSDLRAATSGDLGKEPTGKSPIKFSKSSNRFARIPIRAD